MFGVAFCGARVAWAAPPTPGFPEPVVQWGVQKGETCDDIARALYGSAKWASLLQRYNHVACKSGVPLREGMTLILPEKPTTLPDAKLRSMNPDVRARRGGAAWAPASVGMPLFSNYNVNTLDQGRADVEFIDRTRVFLAPNTLVVIYGTASQTRVSKSPPAAVEVEAGEVKAGLAALRGGAVEVAIKGSGRVSAESRDTVVQRKGERTTVAVFDGKAGVSNAGKSVEVPKNHGTRFVGGAPPIPPRPLPPAPAWLGSNDGVVLAPGGTGTLTATWNAVPAAVSYRFEIARDPEFHDLVVREEVPATITAFRGEKIPIGTYYLAVRAIDKEEYLGVAAETRVVRLVDARLDSGAGRLSSKEIEANPYGVLKLGSSPQLEMSIDEGPFGPIPDAVDLRRRAPHTLRIRALGAGEADTIAVHYTKVGASIEASLDAKPGAPSRLDVRATLTGFEGVDVGSRVAPSGRARLPGGVRTFPLVAGPNGTFTGSLDLGGDVPDSLRLDVVDDRGAVLGTTDWSPRGPEKPASPNEPPRYPQIGAYAPVWLLSPSADVIASAPTPADGASVGVGMTRAHGGWTFQGQARASGSIGPVGVDAALRTDTTDGKTSDGAAWLGLRVRAFRIGASTFELAPALRVGFPISSSGAPARLEPSIAIGGVAGRFTWLADVGARVRLAQDEGLTGTPPAQGFIIAGGTMDVLRWLRINAALDAHLVARDGGTKNVLAGLGAGIEAGTWIYGGLGLHLAPWTDPELGPFTGQLTLGFRRMP
ncbi:Hypothetical protein A7982_09730 [Minicystis rosea]|nr:Hypothetical protein A7982_09730 [Minicystis rosea]